MRFAVRTSASVATAVALGCFLTGCQAVQYGVGSNSKNIKMDQTTDPIDFSRPKFIGSTPTASVLVFKKY